MRRVAADSNRKRPADNDVLPPSGSVSLRVIVPHISRVGMSSRVGELLTPIIPGNYVSTLPSREENRCQFRFLRQL